MDDEFINIKGKILSFISRSGRILVFSSYSNFNDYIKIITGHNNVVITDEKSEKSILDAVLDRLPENKARKILLDLLSQYTPSSSDKSEYNSLKHDLEMPNYGICKIFISILHSTSIYVDDNVISESKLILNCVRDIANSSTKNDRDVIYRRLSIDTDKFISSICSNILSKYYRKSSSEIKKIKKSKRLNKIVKLLKTNDIGKIHKINKILKDEVYKKQLNKIIKILDKMNIPSKEKLIKILQNIDLSSKNDKNSLRKITKKFKDISALLDNEGKIINSQLSICKGSENILNGIKKIYLGINGLRNGFDDAHGLDDNDIKHPSNYKLEIILDLNITAALSQFLIDYFKK